MRALSVLVFFAVSFAAIQTGIFAESVLPAPIVDRDFYDDGRPSADKVELGRMLFFDKILSGNRNISCATCHHPELASADAVALAFGEGGHGLGTARRNGKTLHDAVHERIPRNAPALFNLGTREYTRMFHDGRVEIDPKGYYEGGFISPAKWKLPTGLDNVLAAQAMFPVTSPAEMAGQKGENDVADARSLNNAAGPGGVWDLLARRLQSVPGYVALFRAAYPEAVKAPQDITYVMAANAIAAFEATAFRADQSPFDQHLRGEAKLPAPAQRGMQLFYGRAGCSDCHSGPLQTDHDFHAIAMPQIGPGKADGKDATYWNATGTQAFLEDFGRGRVTWRAKDRYKFRTPSLRNVELTGPWGHSGAYDSLEAVVRHHLDPVAALVRYTLPKTLLPALDRVVELQAEGDAMRHAWLTGTRLAGFLARDDFVQRQQSLRDRIAAANELAPRDLEDGEVADLIAFLKSLTDPRSRSLTHLIPERVPSGLPVGD